MRVIQLSAKAGADGRLHLDIPAEAGMEFDVAVVLTACSPVKQCVAGEEEAIEGEIEQTLETVEEGLKAMVRAFRLPETAYYSVPDTANPPRFNDYEHLARLKEWAALDDSSDEEAA